MVKIIDQTMPIVLLRVAAKTQSQFQLPPEGQPVDISSSTDTMGRIAQNMVWNMGFQAVTGNFWTWDEDLGTVVDAVTTEAWRCPIPSQGEGHCQPNRTEPYGVTSFWHYLSLWVKYLKKTHCGNQYGESLENCTQAYSMTQLPCS